MAETTMDEMVLWTKRPVPVFKFMMLLCKSQLNENESQAAYIASHMFHEFKE